MATSLSEMRRRAAQRKLEIHLARQELEKAEEAAFHAKNPEIFIPSAADRQLANTEYQEFKKWQQPADDTTAYGSAPAEYIHAAGDAPAEEWNNGEAQKPGPGY